MVPSAARATIQDTRARDIDASPIQLEGAGLTL
jgi:hypothetical protein